MNSSDTKYELMQDIATPFYSYKKWEIKTFSEWRKELNVIFTADEEVIQNDKTWFKEII